MTHVELSLSGAFVPQARTPAEAEFVTSIDRWTTTVAGAIEPCIVIDYTFAVLAVSASGSSLLSLGNPADVLGKPLLGGSLRLIDFTAGRGELTGPELEKIPPLLALTTRRLARGLMRLQPAGGASDLTIDAISTPLWARGQVTASLTFLSRI